MHHLAIFQPHHNASTKNQIPLVDAMLTQGMSPGAAMSFIIAGGVTCIPAAVAVWALVKPKVFIAYLVYAAIGAVCAGITWQAISL